jgi:hypothetical protein
LCPHETILLMVIVPLRMFLMILFIMMVIGQ